MSEDYYYYYSVALFRIQNKQIHAYTNYDKRELENLCEIRNPEKADD